MLHHDPEHDRDHDPAHDPDPDHDHDRAPDPDHDHDHNRARDHPTRHIAAFIFGRSEGRSSMPLRQ